MTPRLYLMNQSQCAGTWALKHNPLVEGGGGGRLNMSRIVSGLLGGGGSG